MSSYLCESHQSDRIMWNLKSHLRLYPFRGRFEDWDLVLGLNLERGLGWGVLALSCDGYM